MLSQWLEYRRKLVQDRVDLSNRITATLKNYYPQVLDWCKEKDTIVFCDSVLRWTSLSLVKAARISILLKFFNQHNSRYPGINEKRIKNIKTSIPLTDDNGVIEPNRIMIELLVAQLKLLIASVDRMDNEIRKYYKKPERSKIMDTLAI